LISTKVSQNEKELKENIEAILDAVSKKQILKAYLKSTTSPSVKIAV
jgi:ribosomal protein L1